MGKWKKKLKLCKMEKKLKSKNYNSGKLKIKNEQNWEC